MNKASASASILQNLSKGKQSLKKSATIIEIVMSTEYDL